MSKVVLPLSPFDLSKLANNGQIRLPITLPITFPSAVEDGKIVLPITLPITFTQGNVERKTAKLPVKITCNYANEQHSIKLSVHETANTTLAKLPLKEISWLFHGVVLEENIVGLMNKPLVLIEDVRGRILTELTMLNGNDIEIKWFGDEVPAVEIYKKMTVDLDYEKIGTYEWDKQSAVITLGNSEHNILLKGINSTGESNVISLGEPEYIGIDTILGVPVNEKIYDFNIECTSVYRIEVNY